MRLYDDNNILFRLLLNVNKMKRYKNFKNYNNESKKFWDIITFDMCLDFKISR